MRNKILICDDDEGILEMLEVIFSDQGFEVIPELNSLNVHELVVDRRPDLVVLDLWMPVISGDQVLKSLRKDPLTHAVPVLVISASNDGKKIAMDAGASDFVAKPFDLDLLLSKINTLLGAA